MKYYTHSTRVIVHSTQNSLTIKTSSLRRTFWQSKITVDKFCTYDISTLNLLANKNKWTVLLVNRTT